MGVHLNNDNEYNYILENMDCKIANDIEECVTEKLTCSDDMDAKELAKEFIWSITDAICMIRYEWIIILGFLRFIFWLDLYLFLLKAMRQMVTWKIKTGIIVAGIMEPWIMGLF